jgi:hypothetical protein
MQLNESTYETIFLLYIDNELSHKERLEVEAFIAAHPGYAREMEALKATVLSSENLQYPFKENLKQQSTETSLEGMVEGDLVEEWDQNYSKFLKADVEAIPGLSTPFKNSLKKATASEAIIVKSFGFNQQKFTYAAVAACLLVFIGYQQLTKTPVSNSIAVSTTNLVVPNTNSNKSSDEIALSNASPKTKQEVIIKQQAITQQQASTKLQESNASKTQRINVTQQESIAMAETTPNNSVLDNQAVMKEIPRTYNNPITINATTLPVSSANIDAEPTIDEKGLTTYEVIDTEDPNRNIFIANFEIDGNKFRGITRRVSAFLKRNKSEKEK